MTPTSAYAPPSAIARASLSFALLLGFYLTLLGLSTFLFVLPLVALKVGSRITWGHGALFLFAWTPAVLLVKSAFTTRRPKFEPPPRLLTPSDAPALFAVVEELAKRAGTAPPTEIYLDPLPNLSVTEVGGMFKPRRVLVVGAPIFRFLTVDELRAGIAHELGHFIGGDTRLTTFNVQTHALFTSVLDSVERDPFRVGTRHVAIELGLAFAETVGNGLVKVYSRLFLRLTMPLSRRQELAADALSATLVGAPIAASALERYAIHSQVYNGYLEREVGFAVRQGAMPTDLFAGFDRMRERFLSGDDGRKFVDSVKTEETDAFDTHPALIDRLRAIENLPNVPGKADDRPALVLFPDAGTLEAWLVQATRERVVAAVVAEEGRVGTLRELPWAQIQSETFVPGAKETARSLAAKMHPLFPQATSIGAMFAAVFRSLSAGNTVELAVRFEPGVRSSPPEMIQNVSLSICSLALGSLLQAALLDRGATIEDSLGVAHLILRLGDERIEPLDLGRRFAAKDDAARAALTRWVETFEAGG